ncbi:hydroxyacid dehydrogenase [Streptomyces venezuelae]|uniref:D-3-phosphoglycerate dehydrogenase n=2 Tax=Streptomyces TaxID=1883 RepID=F2R492_STRVP|nr:hydroxyacid dehydrogenase [Streptomyces venezuelae]APE19602.1 oxidoreductase [Streptomyces venezuelae]QER97015.1 oxidoreductase [Streptomyces venezuelae ATCC 10712]CCA53369.1 D-3-phosphoglycerate dehydrogenase [Streptomyces venezuelae ATCC 10712]
MAAATRTPTVLLVMEEERRADVYPAHVLDDIGRLVHWHGPALTRDALRDALRADRGVLDGVDVLLTGWGAPVLDAALLAHAPRLRAVMVAAGSVRHLTTPEFWARDIPIVSAARANAVPVAEFSLAQILLGLKQVHRLGREVTAGRRFPHDPRVPGGYGSRVGLFGLGEIGRLVAEHLRHFDVEVLACDPVVDPVTAAGLGVRLTGIEELFEACHVVSVHAPLLPETERLVGRRLMALLPEGATLINTARGAVLDEPEVIAVLRDRPDLTAVLDVTWPEPPDPGSPLFTLPNVLLTPHLAGALGGERARLGELVRDELRRFVRGEPLLHAIEPSRAATRA